MTPELRSVLEAMLGSGDPHKIRHATKRFEIDAQPKLPSLFTQAKNFANAAIQHVAAGMPIVTEDQYQARLTVCRTTDSGKPCKNLMVAEMRCAKCGCNLTGSDLTAKARWKDQNCPIKLWADLTDVSKPPEPTSQSTSEADQP